jgi:hypothetical protein
MKSKYHELRNPKHQPVFLVRYIEYDGPYANKTDCEYLSLGWAQYEPSSASLKAFRYTGKKWSRQSEEIPLHRAVDLVILLASAVGNVSNSRLGAISFPANTFEKQRVDLRIDPRAEEEWGRKTFTALIMDKRVRTRLKKLRDVLNGLSNI